MTAQPRWEDSGQGDLLELVAQGDAAWFGQGIVDPNRLRRLLRGLVKPQRIGAFTSRALAQGLVEYTGQWVVSTDTEGRNSGKPCRELRWIGGAL